MKKKIYFNFILAVLFMIVPSVFFAFEVDPNESPEIDPPPSAPIDGALIYVFVGAILLAVYFFYLCNLKNLKK